MRFAKTLETDTLARDAKLVNEIYVKYKALESATTEKAFRAAQDWFTKKHHCAWREHLSGKERQR